MRQYLLSIISTGLIRPGVVWVLFGALVIMAALVPARSVAPSTLPWVRTSAVTIDIAIVVTPCQRGASAPSVVIIGRVVIGGVIIGRVTIRRVIIRGVVVGLIIVGRVIVSIVVIVPTVVSS